MRLLYQIDGIELLPASARIQRLTEALMRPDDLKEHLDRRPFQPFRIHLSNGVFFGVRNPDMVSVMLSTAHLGLPLEGDRQRFAILLAASYTLRGSRSCCPSLTPLRIPSGQCLDNAEADRRVGVSGVA